ncbi:MAG TPA: hypothetical protein VK166_02820, partial [Chitinophagaceae bacterium]|nr:hypothetical protein [Chitinophagaceae bacterium]
MKRLSFILPFIILSVILTDAAIAQGTKQQRDSLTKLIAVQKGSAKTSTLLALAKSYWTIKNDSSFYFA